MKIQKNPQLPANETKGSAIYKQNQNSIKNDGLPSLENCQDIKLYNYAVNETGKIKCPSHINRRHWKEWLNSGVDPEIIELNVKSLKGDITHQYLLEDALGKLGEGKQTPHSSQYATSEVVKLRNRYSHTLNGGWWCSGVDPFNKYQLMQWGCFKPNTPRPDPKKPDKRIKYEHPPNTPTRALFLRVPKRIWQEISDIHGVPIGDCEEFWEWVLVNNLPIILCEGAKKAAALLSCGFIAIALPGINGAYRKSQTNQKKHNLIPDIELFATPKREIHFCFDNDLKPTTRINVKKAIDSTSRLLKAKKCQIKICGWNYEEKGIDDVLVAHGQAVVEKIITNALPLATWQTQPFYQLSKKINLNLNQQYLGDILTNISQKVIGVISPKGTGKTESLKPLVENLVNEGYSIYLISHRIQLCQALCGRLNIPYIDDIGSGRASRSKGFGVVIDSLHGQGKGQFDVENDEYLLNNKYVVIIDEIEQVLWHLLNSNTEVKNHRTEIIKQLELLLFNADKILGLDADLTDISLDFIKNATQCQDDDFYIINNEYKPTGYKVFNYEENTPVNWLRDLLIAIGNGDKVLIATDSQKVKSRFSTQTIEAFILKKLEDNIIQKYPHLKDLILRIDSETIADPEHPAYGCITKINDIISQYHIVLISPSVGTGISIDTKNHFASVWGCFQGVQSENAVRQQLMRLRDNVPRHLWIAPTGLSWQGDCSTSLYSILTSNKKQFKIHLNQLRNTGFEILEDTINTNDSALNCYAKMACRINHEMGDYRAIILKNLIEEGHTIINQSDIEDDTTKEEITTLRDELYLQELDDIAATNVDDLDDDKYQQLCNQKAKTKLDRYREKKYSIKKRYQVDVTPDLIFKDDDGYYPKLRLHYYLTMALDLAVEKDHKPAKKMRDDDSVFLPDFNRSQRVAILNLLRSLNIPQILQMDKFTQVHPLLTDMADKVKNNIWDVGMFLGKLHPDMTSIQILRKILKLLGLKLDKVGREGSGDRHWIYKVTGLEDGRKEIFEKWYLLDTSPKENGIATIPNPSQITNINTISNQDVTININQDVDINQENGIAAIPNPSQITNINNIPDQDVAINQDVNQSSITHNQLTKEPQTEPENTPRNCLVWDVLTGQWVGAVLKTSETLASGCFKALVTLWNGLDRCIWESSHISIC